VQVGKVRMAVGQERLCERGCSVGITDGMDLCSMQLRWTEVS
jgi:hypothetical protein